MRRTDRIPTRRPPLCRPQKTILLSKSAFRSDLAERLQQNQVMSRRLWSCRHRGKMSLFPLATAAPMLAELDIRATARTLPQWVAQTLQQPDQAGPGCPSRVGLAVAEVGARNRRSRAIRRRPSIPRTRDRRVFVIFPMFRWRQIPTTTSVRTAAAIQVLAAQACQRRGGPDFFRWQMSKRTGLPSAF